MNRLLDCADKTLDLSRPAIMGILNVTPDSFSDGGRYIDPELAVQQALEMQRDGAAIIDVGGESTRPGARAVSAEEELGRVLPVIEALASELSIPVSIDTSKAEVMRAAVAAGAGLINDVMALRGDKALSAAAECGVPVCLMHMQGRPRNMQNAPEYNDVVTEVFEFLMARAEQCEKAGIDRRNILIDPGFGFGKDLSHNICLFRQLPVFTRSAYPVLVGVSRKSMFAAITGADVDDRVVASVTAAVLAARAGAALLRVHDVKQTRQALQVLTALSDEPPEQPAGEQTP